MIVSAPRRVFSKRSPSRGAERPTCCVSKSAPRQPPWLPGPRAPTPRPTGNEMEGVVIAEKSCIIPQQKNAMGSLHNIDFGVLWASWGGSGKEPGSGNRFWKPVPGFDAFRQVPGSQGRFRELVRFRWVRSCEGSRFQRLRSPGLGSCRCFEGFGAPGFDGFRGLEGCGVPGFDGF